MDNAVKLGFVKGNRLDKAPRFAQSGVEARLPSAGRNWVCLLWSALAVAATGCGQDSNKVRPACTPHATQSCRGSGDCNGVQSCEADGIGFTPCACVLADAAVPEDDGGVDAGRPCDTSFLRGINLGNRLEASPNEGSWGPSLQPAEFGYIAKRGFDHVRLPVFFSGHATTTDPYTVDETFFQRVTWAIDHALDQCLSVVVDMHNYAELMSQPADNTERFLAIWSQIAQRYQCPSARAHRDGFLNSC